MNQRRWGAILSYVNIVATVVVGLLYTPIMLRLLGQSEYGLYSLIGSVVGYLSVLDMGLGNTIVRYTAKNRVDGTEQKEAELNGLFLQGNIESCFSGYFVFLAFHSNERKDNRCVVRNIVQDKGSS